MRKRNYLLLMLVIFLGLGLLYGNYVGKNRVFLAIDGGGPYVAIHQERSVNRVDLWQDEEEKKDYFFLPSCVRAPRVKLKGLEENKIWIDGTLYEEGDIFRWEEEREYQMQVTNADYEVRTYAVTFMRSANIPAVFIHTDSGSMEDLNADKENEETGEICIVREDGNTEYQGRLERISGRGNSTWNYEKKPYALKLAEKSPLCGLDRSDRWRLLALWREGSKMDNKIAMDLAQEMGMAYSTQGAWIDLYLNGEYAGCYLLTESVSVGEGRVDIYDLEKDNKRYNKDIDNATPYQEENSKGYLIENGDNITGGYLIEKDHPKHYAAEANGFVTPAGEQFTINAPRHASREQVEYIRACVENIERMVLEGDPQIWEYLDLDSFARRFLLEEVVLNTDAGLTSMFFYKEQNDGKLYSGPMWDYDNSLGERNSDSEAGYDYTLSIVETTENASNVLDWYARLYENPQLRARVVEEYRKILPFFEELLESGIDEYAEWIGASLKMDSVLWADKNIKGDSTGKYPEYADNIKYLKYFIARRLNWLCERWDVAHEEFPVPSDGSMHTVTFANYEGVIDTMEIMDGQELEHPLEYDESMYQGWTDEYTGERYRRQIPIYADTVFYNAKWE